MVGRVRATTVESPVDGCISPPQATPLPRSLADARAAKARAAPLGPDRPRARRIRGLLRVRVLPRLGRRPGGGGHGRRHPLPLRRRRLPGAGGAVRGRRAARRPPDDAGTPSLQDGRGMPGGRAHARPRRRIARARPRRHTARRLPRSELPARTRRAGRRVSLLGRGQAVFRGGRAHPLRVPDAGRRAVADRRLDRGRGAGRPSSRDHDHRARAPRRRPPDPPAGCPAGTRRPRADRARDSRGGAGVR